MSFNIMTENGVVQVAGKGSSLPTPVGENKILVSSDVLEWEQRDLPSVTKDDVTNALGYTPLPLSYGIEGGTNSVTLWTYNYEKSEMEESTVTVTPDIAEATVTRKGLMSTDDKSKLDNLSKTDVGLGNVDNKSSETIRSEITKKNVTDALGYTPIETDTNTTYEFTGTSTGFSWTSSDLQTDEVIIPNATTKQSGLMSASDKTTINKALTTDGGTLSDTLNTQDIIPREDGKYNLGSTLANGNVFESASFHRLRLANETNQLSGIYGVFDTQPTDTTNGVVRLRIGSNSAGQLKPTEGRLNIYNNDGKYSSVQPQSGDASNILYLPTTTGELINNNALENIIPYPYSTNYGEFWETFEHSGITYTVNSNGTITSSEGNPSALTLCYLCYNMPMQAGTYSLSGCPASSTSDTDTSRYIRVYDRTSGSNTNIATDYGEGVTFTLTQDSLINIAIRHNTLSSGEHPSYTFRPMLVRSTQPTNYKSPANIQVVNYIKDMTAENLVTYPYYRPDTYTTNGITFTVDGVGKIHTSGTLSGNSAQYYVAVDYVFKKGITYTLSGCPSGGSSTKYRLVVYKNSTYYLVDTGNGSTYTFPEDTIADIRILVYNNQELTFEPMLTIGDEVFSYKSPINSNASIMKKLNALSPSTASLSLDD